MGATTSSSRGSNNIIVSSKSNDYQQEFDQLKNLRGYNNGTWGYGMSGAFFPENLNGPLGYLNAPLPNVINYPVMPGPQYNSPYGNFPSYNQDFFIEIAKRGLTTNSGPGRWPNQ
jgi:hypothetical protein